MTNQSLGKEVNNRTDLRRGSGRRSQQSVKAATGCVDEQCRQTTTMSVSDDVRCQRVVMSPVDDNEQRRCLTTMIKDHGVDNGTPVTSQRLRL